MSDDRTAEEILADLVKDDQPPADLADKVKGQIPTGAELKHRTLHDRP